ncbi:MAG: glutamyl-tRNA reductase [Myxococcota bacterium]
MKLFVAGMSYRTAPVAVRERYAVTPAQLAERDAKLVRSASLDEGAILSTCNRTEILGVSRAGEAALERMHRFLHAELGDGSAAAAHVYELRDGEVVRHLFRVAGGLDSMVLGEAQILGQLKLAYRAAVDARTTGPVLNRLFQHAFRTAKRIHHETGLGAASVSVARVGVQLAREIFESFDGKQVLLIGAGEMAESALRGLREAGASHPRVVNRTLATAVELAGRHGGTAHPMESLAEELARADVAISSVQVDRPLIGRPELERALAHRRGHPLLLIDLGVPRNVDTAVQALENVYVYDLDDLEATAERGRASRASAADAAGAIAREEGDRFLHWLAVLPHAPTIRELRERLEAQALDEVRRTVSRLGAPGESLEPELERMARAIVAKLLHQPLEQLRREASSGFAQYYAGALRELFGLEEEDP